MYKGNTPILKRYVGTNLVFDSTSGGTEESSCFVSGTTFSIEWEVPSGNSNAYLFLRSDVATSDSSNLLYTYTATTNPLTIEITDENVHVIQTNSIWIKKINSMPDIKYKGLNLFLQYNQPCEEYNFSCLDMSEDTSTTFFNVPSATTTFIADDMKFSSGWLGNSDFYKLWSNASKLKYLSIKNWPTEDVTSGILGFYYCKALETLDVTGCKFSHITSHTSWFTSSNAALKTIILGETTQDEYDWWYARLQNAGIQNQVTIEYTIV